MHKEVREFIERMRDRFPKEFQGAKVIEMGSLDVNGSPRRYFNGGRYLGVDWRQGKGVDVVSFAHEYSRRSPGYFDFAISTEMLEHDPYSRSSVRKMLTLIRRGGCLLITCAGPGRHAHDVATSPRPDHYANIDMMDLVGEIFDRNSFKAAFLEDDPTAKDLRFFGWRKR